MKYGKRMMAMVLCMMLLCSAVPVAWAEEQWEGGPETPDHPTIAAFSSKGVLTVMSWGSEQGYPVILAIYDGTTGQMLHIGRSRAEQGEFVCQLNLDYFSLPKDLRIRAYWVDPVTMCPTVSATEKWLILAEDLEDMKAEIYRELDKFNARDVDYFVPYATLGDTEIDMMIEYIQKHPNRPVFSSGINAMGANAYSVSFQNDKDIIAAMRKWMDEKEELPGERAQELYDAMTAAYEVIRQNAGTGSDYELVKAIHDYLILHVEYDCAVKFDTIFGTYGVNCYDAYGALVQKLCVCEGYAESFDLLCWMFDIPCCIAISLVPTTSGKEGHAWNLVQVDDAWYHVDATWDDGKNDIIKYDYFLVSDIVMECSHDWGQEIPGCTFEGWPGDFITAPASYGESSNEIPEELLELHIEEYYSYVHALIEGGGGAAFLPIPEGKAYEAFELMTEAMDDGKFGDAKIAFTYPEETLHTLTVHVFDEEDAVSVSTAEAAVQYLQGLIEDSGRTQAVIFSVPEEQGDAVIEKITMAAYTQQLFGDWDEIRVSCSRYAGEEGLIYVATTDLKTERAVLFDDLLDWYLEQIEDALERGDDTLELPMAILRESVYGDAIEQKVDEGYFDRTDIEVSAEVGSGQCWIWIG